MTASVSGKPRNVPWSPKEVDYLYRHYNDMSMRQIAKKLKRGYSSVYLKMLSLGLRKDIQDIRGGALKLKDVCEILGCTENRVYDFIYSNNLPTRKVGSFYVIYETELHTWLRSCQILRFEREHFTPFYQRMYDEVRKQYYSSKELRSFDIACLRPHGGRYQGSGHPKCALTAGTHKSRQYFYRKTEVWEWAYKLGHVFCNDKLTHPDFIAIQTAWNSEFITTFDLYTQFSEHSINKYRRRRGGFPAASAHREAYRRKDLADWFRPFRPDISQKLYRGLPVSYEQMIADYERRAQGGVYD